MELDGAEVCGAGAVFTVVRANGSGAGVGAQKAGLLGTRVNESNSHLVTISPSFEKLTR